MKASNAFKISKNTFAENNINSTNNNNNVTPIIDHSKKLSPAGPINDT
jgi:hypothetical protein